MTTDFPMFTISLSIRRPSGCTAAGALTGWVAATEPGTAGWPPVGFTDSSRFHISSSASMGTNWTGHP
jgi:hypothetical protein